jgi:hypothetical protein
MTLSDTVRRWFLRLVRYVMPLSLAVFVVIALVGSYRPTPSDEEPLRSYAGKIAVLIGFAEKASWNSSKSTHRSSRTYIVFPDSLTRGAVTVTTIDGRSATLSWSLVTLILMVVWMTASIVATWMVWIRASDKRGA